MNNEVCGGILFCVQEQIHLKMACVGLVGAIACTPDGVYCAAGVGEKIHFWEVCLYTSLGPTPKNFVLAWV